MQSEYRAQIKEDSIIIKCFWSIFISLSKDIKTNQNMYKEWAPKNFHFGQEVIQTRFWCLARFWEIGLMEKFQHLFGHKTIY